MEKRVKLLELQVKTIENNEKATRVIPVDLTVDTKPKKGAKKNAINK